LFIVAAITVMKSMKRFVDFTGIRIGVMDRLGVRSISMGMVYKKAIWLIYECVTEH
jgi:hypothetical protein